MLTGGFINRIFVTALIAGVVAGLFLSGLQHFTIIPMVLEAETYETNSGSHDAESASQGQHSHDNNGVADEASAWSPQDGAQRISYTFLTSTIIGIGFAFLLVGCYAFLKTINWKKGMLWGLGGFIAFHLAPAVGLPPELPGAAAAGLESRQLWWVLTAASTAGGLLVLAFAPVIYKFSGVLLILAPQIFGAPQPESHVGLAPETLETAFIVTSLITNAVFWVVLGAITAGLYNRFERPAPGLVSTST